MAYAPDVSGKTLSIGSVSMVFEFPNIFSADLPCLALERDMDLSIDMELGTKPISIPPYSMAPAKLKELSVSAPRSLKSEIHLAQCLLGVFLSCLFRRRIVLCRCALTIDN